MTKRKLATGFQDVASADGDNQKETNSNSKNDSNSNNDNVIADVLDLKPRSKTHDFRGYYLEHDVIKTIDTVASERKGSKSDIVNRVLKHYFQQHGYMK